jgi:CheY-like chemotaxis protein/nitrogen-specific signal transduction histidine kinase
VLRVSTACVADAEEPLVLALIADVTARKRLEEQLTDAQRFEAIASLAGGVAHDFNNLLTVILGYSGMLLRGLDGGAPEREPLEAIQDAGNHAAVITNQLLSLSRHQVLQPETIDPAARCAALLPMLRRLAGDGVEVEVREADGGRIRVDPGQLEQVLFNLVGNSRDAMPDGGRIIVEAGEVVRGATGDVVVVRVTDDGAGMDAQTLARSQEPFFTTKGHNRGTGLGLATVASILERSGGTFALTSVLGVGTTASASFPSVAEPAAGDEAPTAPPSGRVLLVDDDEQVRTFAEGVLRDAGYDVVAVEHAERAVAELSRGGFALLVTDIALPGANGTDLVRTVRARWPEVACILISGFTGTQPFDRTELGDTVLVIKPFTPEALTRAASTVLLSGSVSG